MNWSKRLFKIFKILIIVISIGYVVFKLRQEWHACIAFISSVSLSPSVILGLLFAIVLVFVNWGLESVKFKLLVKPFQQISFSKSFQAVFAGITVSIFTPKRVGEFGGRIFVLYKGNRVDGVFATLLGNFSQLLITIIAGLCFLPFYLSVNPHISGIIAPHRWVFIVLAILTLLSIFLYFNMAYIGTYLFRYKFFKKNSQFIQFLHYYSSVELLIFLSISMLRYMIFTTQFFILLKLAGTEIYYLHALVGIGVVYLLMTVIPTYAFGELGVRGSVSVWILGAFTTFSSGVLMAAVFLWIINLALPALVGTYFLSRLKF